MDQAAQLRKLVTARHSNLDSVKFISVISGKGGVGKTSLVKDLYEGLNNSYIVDCDMNSPYFWRHEKSFACCDGFETLNGRNVLKPVDKRPVISKYETILVDAGTGLNDINRYFVNKSKLTVFVSSMDEIAILNSMNLMKKISGAKMLYIPNVDDKSILEMQSKINMYAKLYLEGSRIVVTNSMDTVFSCINKER